MVSQYNTWPCPACGARVTDLARPEALAPEHRVCERCWREARDAAVDAAYKRLTMARVQVFSFDPEAHRGIPALVRRIEALQADRQARRERPVYTCPDCGAAHTGWADGRYVSKWWCPACYRRRRERGGEQ